MDTKIALLVDTTSIIKYSLQADLYSLCDNLSAEGCSLHIYLLGQDPNNKDITQINEKLEKYSNKMQTFHSESNPELIFLAKRHLDDRNLESIFITSSDDKIHMWKALTNILMTARQYEFSFKTLGEASEIEPEIDLKHLQEECREMLKTINTNEPIRIIKSPLIPKDIFYHGYTTRIGGVSSIAGLKSLNLLYITKKKDPKIVIEENVRRVAEAGNFKPESFTTPLVDHGNIVWQTGTPKPEVYDGMVTVEQGITLAAPGADCLDLIFADPIKKCCGVAHSGWKGTVSEIAKEVIKKMTELGSNTQDILVTLGPGVEGSCFVLGTKDAQKFKDISLSECLKYNEKDDNYHVDLFKANLKILERNGILPENIDSTTATYCTVCNPDLFFSCVRDKTPFGNQFGYIGLHA
ncbi:purine nucleoside phosphorylase LACC1 [Octopus sinensis]|nr:purine nucleoside phosphorylase LACC1 [Octopus sinensis]XP_029633132.1 purine nucleoside phosphorylase LACC1 [Octopus sinensis]